MFHNGFLKVSCATPDLEVGNPKYNASCILDILSDTKSSVCVFPELCLTGYTCGDLFYQNMLIKDALFYLLKIVKENTYKGLFVVGCPIEYKGSLYNCGVVIYKNEILGIVPKRSLPNSSEFYEKRWFKSSNNDNLSSVIIDDKKIPFGNIIFSDVKNNIHIGVEICEDMWSTISPGNILSLKGANVILNLSASNETLGKSDIRKTSVLENSRRNCGAYIYASAGVNESTTDTVFSGHNMVCQVGKLLKETENFSTNNEVIYADIDIDMINFKRRSNTNFHDYINIEFNYQRVMFNLEKTDSFAFENEFDKTPFVPKDECVKAFDKISSLQEFALFKRIKHTNCKTLVIGISGGLDSTLALLVCVCAFKKLNKDLKDIIAVTMPGMGTSDRTYNNALLMMKSLGVTILNKPIVNASLEQFELIGHDKDVTDTTYENVQARIRTMILMNLANKHNGLVIGTGDLSELALGWCTYNGDQMSMYGINAGIPKTLVKFVVTYYAKVKFGEIYDILKDIVDTPISPELLPGVQKTEDSVGKYDINDFILYRFLSCGDDEARIKYLLEITFNLDSKISGEYVKNFFFRFFTQQFKRQALPDSPKILDVSLASRSDYRIPSDIKRW